MQLFLISAGTPTPTESRFGTCYVLQVGQDHLMFDCGPAATHKLVKAGLFPTQIDYLFFTHHHYDHNVDYPCFLLTRWNHQTGKENRLRVWGPPPIQQITERLIGEDGAFSDDWTARVSHPGSQDVHVERGGTLPRPKPAFDVSEIEPGAEITGNGWQVTTALAQHQQPWLQSLAYRVDSEEGSIVITGDAVPNKSLAELSHGVETLIVNCWDHQSRIDARTSIAGTLDAAKIAHEAGAKRLVLAHSLARLTRPGSREKGIGDIARVYEGEIIFGEELMGLEL
jgi:ribonuclease BN (tRNA processing enzyme)